MEPNGQVLLSVGIPTIDVLVGILLNNRQTDSLRAHMDAQFVSLRSEMNARFAAVDARFNAANEALLRVEGVFDARLSSLENRERR